MKTKLTFDDNGFLIPYEGIETNLKTIQKYFVRAFPNSETRENIFENYEKFVSDFQREIFPHFEQWIGGSFVSKKENPNDIDIVTFLDYRVFELREKKLDEFWNFSLEDKFIDSYIVREFPEEHENFSKFLEVRNEKVKLYATTRNNIARGYLKVIFTK